LLVYKQININELFLSSQIQDVYERWISLIHLRRGKWDNEVW